MTNLYKIVHKPIWASAIALAVFAIGSAAAADSTSNNSRTTSREASNGVIYSSSAEPRASFIELSTQAAIASPTSNMKQTRNWDTTEGSTLTGSNPNLPGDPANDARVANALGNGNYDGVFEHANSSAKVSLLVAKKCGWLCVRVRF